ncbi:MAG: hypothetical protein KGK10_06055 [Rhodospirillales bacterium]|nr:hypothetical protein [Rhodospirillales bacterium]
MAELSQSDFATLLRRAGLDLSAAEIEELYTSGYQPFAPMMENVRAGGSRPRESEPAHVFSVDDRA